MGVLNISGKHNADYLIMNDHCSSAAPMPGKSCDVAVAFWPRNELSMGAQLEIPSNVLITGQVNIALTGAGEFCYVKNVRT